MYDPTFYIALFVHLVALIVGFGAVIVIDVFGFLLMLRKIELPFMNKMAGITQRLIWIGWIGLVLSGIVLVMEKGFVSNLASIKIFLVALLGLNGFNLHFIKRATESYFTYSEIPTIYKFRMFVATVISQIGWWGAMVIGFVNRHIGVARNWPENPSLYVVSIAIGILIVWAVGELVIKSKSA